jgi:hypothetical protein
MSRPAIRNTTTLLVFGGTAECVETAEKPGAAVEQLLVNLTTASMVTGVTNVTFFAETINVPMTAVVTRMGKTFCSVDTL